jgi:quercetin dioxygenase-like cupin family protein
MSGETDDTSGLTVSLKTSGSSTQVNRFPHRIKRDREPRIQLDGVSVEIIRRSNVTSFSKGGVTSEQLLFPENSTSQRVTVTRVTIARGARNPRHAHGTSEQIWVALRGNGLLLLGDNETVPFAEGDLARFADGDVHGFENTGLVEFIYLSVTSPPLNFRAAYSIS